MSASPDRGRGDSVLERNLRLLLTRSYVPVAPRESFRAALEQDVVARAARRHGRAPRRERPFWFRPIPLAGVALAATFLAWIGVLVWMVGQENDFPYEEAAAGLGKVALRQGNGPWETLRPEPGAAAIALGPLEFPLQVATPAGCGATLEVAGASLALGPWSRLELAQPGAARLQRGELEVDLAAGAALRLETSEGAAELSAARATLAYAEGPPEHVRIHVASGLALVDDRPQRRRVGAGESVRLVDGAVLTEPGSSALVADAGDRTAVEASEPSTEPPSVEPGALPALNGNVGVLVRDQAGERVEPVRAFRALLLEEVALPAARMPTVLEVDDELGRFAFEGPLEPARYTLFVQAEGFALWRREGLRLGGDPVEVEALLERGTTVRGVVLHAQTGEPVPGAVIVSESDAPVRVLPLDAASLEEMGCVHFVRSGPDGGFELADLARGRQVLRASGGGLSAGWAEPIELEGAAPYEGVEVLLAPGGAVEGEVRDAQGLPRRGAALLASVTDFAQPRPCLSYRQALTDEQGIYRIDGLPAGTAAVLLFVDPDEMDGEAAPDLRLTIVRADETVRVDFAPARASVRLAGRVVGADGAPLATRSVWTVPSGVALDGEAFTSATTREDGTFVFEGLTPGPHEVYVSAVLPPDMTFLGRVEVPAGGLEEVELVAGDGALAGRALIAATLEPLPSGQVVLFERGAGRFAGKTLLAEDGSFRIARLHPGVYDLLVEAGVPGLADARLEAVVVGAGDEVGDLELLLSATGGR